MATNKSFSELRNLSSNIDAISKKLKETEGKKDYTDNRFWKAHIDKAKNGSAEIRFLPAPQGESDAYVKLYGHYFQADGGWFINNCPTTVGRPCPVCEDNGKHWKEGEEGINFVRLRKSKRTTTYITNVLVVKDPANPENEGKVFLFKYGAKIHQKIIDAITPPFEGDDRYIPYDLFTGANFKLRITNVAGFANFDQSVFSKQSAVPGTDEELEAIWKSEYSLQEFVSPETAFKSYEDLEKHLNKVLNNSSSSAVQGRTIEESLSAMTGATKTLERPAAQALAPKAPEELETIDMVVNEDEDDEIEALKKLIS